MKTSLGTLESRLLTYSQLRGTQVARSRDLPRALKVGPAQVRDLLNRLTDAGVITRVCRGTYLLPKRLPLGGAWRPDEALALSTLMAERGARYQVTGPNAFNRFGFDEQVPNRVYAYNDKISGERLIGTVRLTLIEVDSKRLGDTSDFESDEGIKLPYSSRVRALVDAVYDWSRFNGLPRGYDWIRRELKAGRVSAKKLVECALRFGDVSTLRRIGAVLEREGVEAKLVRKLETRLGGTSATIPLVPSQPKRGSVDRRWGLVWNERDE